MKNRVFDSRSESQEHSIFHSLIYDVMGAYYDGPPLLSMINEQSSRR
ncbi:hypothetical protein TZ90_00101 [Streptococcus mitis]|uniref:Uncharacterized protein n=1 Tax=Streptococcus mitis TaxID=28037 RepID=A0A0F2DGU6_STRMT|nr:hypothetical protein TZ90_00101 [Streptococcus mitis]